VRFFNESFKTCRRYGLVQIWSDGGGDKIGSFQPNPSRRIMKSIGIVGSGIAGLQLGLFLQKHGVDATIYSDRSPDEIRASRLSNFVVRFDHTRERERALEVNHWDFADFAVTYVHMNIGIEPPIAWTGSLKRPASSAPGRFRAPRGKGQHRCDRSARYRSIVE